MGGSQVVCCVPPGCLLQAAQKAVHNRAHAMDLEWQRDAGASLWLRQVRLGSSAWQLMLGCLDSLMQLAASSPTCRRPLICDMFLTCSRTAGKSNRARPSARGTQVFQQPIPRTPSRVAASRDSHPTCGRTTAAARPASRRRTTLQQHLFAMPTLLARHAQQSQPPLAG